MFNNEYPYGFDGISDHSRRPYYNDESDYNTNAPSYYDDLARKQRLIEYLAKKIGEYDKEMEKRFREWDKNLEELPDDLKRMFLAWVDDGTLARILAQLMLEDYATKVYVTEMVDKLGDKIDKDLSNVKKELGDKIDNHINIYNKKNEHFIINVDEFTGSDHFIIQSALNKARDKGGGTVYVPSREYLIDKELIIFKNTTVWCGDGAVIKRIKSGYVIVNGESDKNYPRYSGNGNIRLINGTYDGNAQSSEVGIGSNIAIAHAENVVIENVIIKNSNSHHIELNSSRNVVIRNCKFLGASESHTFQEALQLDLSTEDGFSYFGEHDNTPCENVYIIGNYFGRSKELPAIARGIGSHSTRIGAPMRNIFIEDNVFDGCRDFGIQLLSYHDTFIKNNIFNNCVGGIIIYAVDSNNPNHMIDRYGMITTQLQNSKNIVIDGNIFTMIVAKQVIYSYGRKNIANEDIKITNNVINNSTLNNGIIILNNVKNGNVSGNKIYKVGQIGIILENSENFTIDNNNLSYVNGYAGIRIKDKSQNNIITNNVVSYCDGHGIEVSSECNNITISNNIFQYVAGYNNEYEYHGIYVHSSCNYIIVTFNTLRTLPANNFVYVKAVYLTETTNNFNVIGNIAEKGKDVKYLFAGAEDVTNKNI